MGAVGSAVGGLFGIGGGSVENQYQAATGGQNFASLLSNTQNQYNQTFQNQQDLAKQLQMIANGQGPNPAQAMLNQATGQNVANQAALMASQRGASVNPGLVARQAAMQGGNIQQQAVGQGATMQAQQQLGALGGLGNVYGQMANQSLGAQNTYEAALANANGINAMPAAQNAGFRQGIAGGLVGGAGSALMMAEGGEVAPTPIPSPTPEPIIEPNLPGSESAQQSFRKAFHYAEGGSVSDGPSSFVGNFLNSINASSPLQNAQKSGTQAGQGFGQMAGMLGKNLMSSSPMSGAQDITPGGFAGADMGAASPMAGLAKIAANKGGRVPALVSPGEVYLGPDKVKKVADGKANPMKEGEKIPGKAKVKGDSIKNDTVPKTLESGGVVIPRHIMQSKDPVNNAAAFVRAVLAKKGFKNEA